MTDSSTRLARDAETLDAPDPAPETAAWIDEQKLRSGSPTPLLFVQSSRLM